ncbi:hypothetical protein NNO_0643 [Hydrogenimonas sp.]|nr:hypothetical protein NNO_0643 [Hydrogenimonas sp.]
MRIPHAPAKKQQPPIVRKEHGKKSIPFNEELMKPDPDFVDERVVKPARRKNFLERFLDIFD